MEIALPNERTDAEVKKYRNEICHKLKFLEVGKQFRNLSDNGRRDVLKGMSPSLLLLHGIVTLLPEEIMENHILFFMLDGDKTAAEKFCNKSVGGAFQLYHKIKNSIGDANEPIGPLYALKKKELEFVLNIIRFCHRLFPIAAASKKSEINQLLSDEMKRNYVKGKRVVILPDDQDNYCTPEEIGKRLACMICAGAIFSGLLAAYAGLLVGIDDADKGLFISLAPVAIFSSFGFVSACLEGMQSLYDHSQILTL